VIPEPLQFHNLTEKKVKNIYPINNYISHKNHEISAFQLKSHHK